MWPKKCDEFEIAIVCALPIEGEAVEAVLDETYDKSGQIYKSQPGDRNLYTTGRIGEHHVVICHAPRLEEVCSASVASSLLVSYTGVRLALVVGVCGGVPSPSSGAAEIFLGDIIIGDSVIEYDWGSQRPGEYERRTSAKETLGRPNREIRGYLYALSARMARRDFEEQSAEYLKRLQARDGAKWQYPGVSRDILYESSYRNQHPQQTHVGACACTGDGSDSDDTLCKETPDALGYEERIHRRRLDTQNVRSALHIGTIASADTVMRSGEHRDRIAEKEGVIAFESVGVGVWDSVPCVIIKGVSDYADNHADQVWQSYAAATAACGAKTFLGYWPLSARAESRAAQKVRSRVPIPATVFVGRKEELARMKEYLGHPDQGRKGVVLRGLSAYGKTQLAIQYITVHQEPYHSILWIDGSSRNAIHKSFAQIWRKIQGRPSLGQLAVDLVLEWLERETNRPWIMVFDGVEDTDNSSGGVAIDIREYFPSGDHGHILLTTRSPDLHSRLNFADIHLGGVDEHAGSQILLRCAGIDAADPPAVATAKAISRKVGGIPLALEQAGSFIFCGAISMHDYNQQWGKQFVEITLKTPVRKYQGSYEKKHTLWTAFETVYNALSQRNADSVKLLHLVVFLGPGPIPFSLISYLSPDRGECAMVADTTSPVKGILDWLNGLRSRTADFAIAIRDLEMSSLVNFNRKETEPIIESFVVDEMVRSFIQLKLPQEDARNNASVAILLNRLSCASLSAPGMFSSVLDEFFHWCCRKSYSKYFKLCDSDIKLENANWRRKYVRASRSGSSPGLSRAP